MQFSIAATMNIGTCISRAQVEPHYFPVFRLICDFAKLYTLCIFTAILRVICI